MRRLVAVLVFLMLGDDANAAYAEHIFAPLAWTHLLLFEPTPIKVRGFDVIMAVLLVLASKGAAARVVRPMRTALYLAAGTTATWFIIGLARGGDARAASWQVYLMMSAVLFAFTIAANFKTPEHLLLLGKALIVGAMYRAIMCLIYYFGWVRVGAIMPFPEFLTSHDDTVLWVVALTLLVINVLMKATKRPTLLAGLCAPAILFAIQCNTRRLAWVSLVAALVMIYALLKSGPVRKRIHRVGLIVGPIALIYVAIGWGRPERMFKPLQAFATVTTSEDASTKARNVENLGLIATAHEAGPLLGTGFGHRYKELSSKYSIAQYFELWPYIPHNSILGLLAFTGILGFAGFWLAFPTAMFLNTRLARLGATPLERTVGMVGAAQMVVCANQLFGDMGIFSVKAMYLLAVSYAIALRIPISAGVWPGATRTKTKRVGPRDELRDRVARTGHDVPPEVGSTPWPS